MWPVYIWDFKIEGSTFLEKCINPEGALYAPVIGFPKAVPVRFPWLSTAVITNCPCSSFPNIDHVPVGKFIVAMTKIWQQLYKSKTVSTAEVLVEN
jgi:hypothetical protein